MVKKNQKTEPIQDFVKGYASQQSRNARSTAIRNFLGSRFDMDTTDTDLNRYEELANDYIAELKEDAKENGGESVKLVNDLHRYRNALMDGSNTSTTIRNYIAAIIVWMQHSRVKISSTDRKSIIKRAPLPRPETREEPLSKEKIRAILTHASPAGKALMMVLLSTGMRLGETLQLKVKDVNMTANPAVITIPGEYTKNKTGRIVFLNREGREELERWIAYRPEYIRLKNQRYGSFHQTDENDERIFPFNDSTAEKVWKHALKAAHLENITHKTGNASLRLHSFRKYFRTQMVKGGNGNALDMVEKIMGHEGYLSRSYVIVDTEALADFYRSAEHLLYIHDTITFKDPEADKQIAELKEDNAKLNTQVDELRALVKLVLESRKKE